MIKGCWRTRQMVRCCAWRHTPQSAARRKPAKPLSCGERATHSPYHINQSYCIVTKAEIVEKVSTGTGITKIETETIINGFMAIVMFSVQQGKSVELRGFGSFRARYRAARRARNPVTRETVEVAARYVPVFKASKNFREAVDQTMRKYESR